MRALITGAGGQLGTDLARLLPGAVVRTHHQLSISDPRAVSEAIRSIQPEVVFNCAAYNAVDRAETEPDLARDANALGPVILAATCVEFGARLVHFSTNFVFDGTSDRAYRESDLPSPRGVYAASKRSGELGVLQHLPDALVIRSAGLFGRAGSAIKGGSFPERILRRARDGQALKVVSDQFLNPTYTRDLAVATIELVDTGLSGVVHLVAAGCCSFHELAVATLELAGIEARIEAQSTSELGSAAPRPQNGCLESERVPALRSWREGLEDLVRELDLVGGP